MPTSRGSSPPGDRNYVFCNSCVVGGFFTSEPPGRLCAQKIPDYGLGAPSFPLVSKTKSCSSQASSTEGELESTANGQDCPKKVETNQKR